MGLPWASSQGPALSLPPPPKLSAPTPPPWGQRARMMLGAPSFPSEDRAPAGGWAMTEAAARPCVGSVNPTVAEAGASIAPTLHPGALRLL